MDNMVNGLDLCSYLFYDTVNDCFLFQHITQPTKHRHGTESSVLDLVFTNEQNMVSWLAYHPGLENSEHCYLTFQFNCYTILNEDYKTGFNYNKGDYNSLRQLFEEVDWWVVRANENVDNSWNYFLETFK